MAAFAGRVGQGGTASSASSLAVSVTQACAIGASVLLLARGENSGIPSGIADSKSNTWTVEDGSQLATYGCGLYRSNLTTALTTSDTITVSFGTAQAAGIFALADLFTGIGTATSANAKEAPNTNPQVLSVTAGDNDVLIYSAFLFNGSAGTISPTTSTGFTATGTAQTSPATGNASYNTSFSPGSVTASWQNGTTHSCFLYVRAYPPTGTLPVSGALMVFP